MGQLMEPIERKLTTILSADVVGYSRLMGQDEAGTLAAWKACRDSAATLIESHRGRIVGTAGDNILAEFASVVKAVECAVQIQRALGERNAGLPEERQMRLRIGINLGDVMVEKDDLYGDGVNVAERLQSLADAGGIMISGTVFDHVKDKLTVGFDYLGPQPVKNIAAPIPAYRVLLQPGDAPAAPPPPRDATAAPDDRRHRLMVAAARAGVFILLVFAINMFSDPRDLWFQWPTLAILFVFALRAIPLLRPRSGGKSG